MLTLSSINNVKNQMSSVVKNMQTRLDKLNADIVKAKSDGTRSPAYISETVKGLEREAMPFFGDKLKEVSDLAQIIKDQRLTWESKPLLLGKQKFSDDQTEDSTIRLRYATELALMNPELFRMTAMVAKEEKNLPVVYQCLLASISKQEVFDLSDVEIPNQEAALAAIKECATYPAQAELIAGQSTAVALTALRKMELGRQMVA